MLLFSSGWLCPDINDTARARCKYCDVQLRAHKHDLLLHGKSAKHKKCFGTYAGSEDNFITVAFGEAIHGGDVIEESESMDTQDPESRGIKRTADEDGENHDGNGEVGDEHVISDVNIKSEFEGKKEVNVIRVNAPTPRSSGTMRFGKRRRMNVNDVIAAIHQNQFTGYELLQICKAAIPKL